MSDSHHFQQQPHAGTAGYKRASRKGAPRRYACQFPGCNKVYSRQEHLQRHQLNHSPKEIYACDVENCGQRFVRADLLVRHKKRHNGTYIPRNRLQSFTEPAFEPRSITLSAASGGDRSDTAAKTAGAPAAGAGGASAPRADPSMGGHASTGAGAAGAAAAGPFNDRLPPYPHNTLASVPRDAAILLAPDPGNVLSTSTASSMPASAAHLGAGHQGAAPPVQPVQLPAPPPSQVQLLPAPSTWASAMPLPDIADADTMRRGKTGGFYQGLPPTSSQPQQQPQQQQYQPSYHRMNHAQDDAQAHIIPGPVPTNLPFPQIPFCESELGRENFAAWLFDTQTSFGDFNLAQLPFMEGGLESPFNNNLHYDYESLTSRSHVDTPPRQIENSDEAVSETRRLDIVRLFQTFRSYQPQAEASIPSFCNERDGDIPALSVEMMLDNLHGFWDYVSPRVPVIHQPTFSCNRCPPLLLIIMLALGAASRYDRDQTGSLRELGGFADVVITSARFSILMSDEASPPVSLWVAQALLLVEFYEKMASTRRLHERSHIYHSVTLTLLRRGSPLIGRSGSESPPDVTMAQPPLPAEPPSRPLSLSPQPDRSHLPQQQQQQQRSHHNRNHHQQASPAESSSAAELQNWWVRWAETEAMHRVVFVAFCLDITHAAMFGHAADMGPHEIRLPLPCDDNLWTATKPEEVRQLDSNFRMYGVKPISFLDGLKRAVHGKEVKTHSFGRMIIMSGLLSVGWHLGHRETHLKWLDLASPPTETQDSWRKTLLAAFDSWKASFDMVRGGAGSSYSLSSDSTTVGSVSDTQGTRRSGFNGPIQSAAVLYHLAHICLHVDIVDCQVYAGAKRLLGRKVSLRDYENVVTRMKSWAGQASTRHAILHAFRLLQCVLVDPRKSNGGKSNGGGSGGDKRAHSHYMDVPVVETQPYSIRRETDPHRPWIMYYAALGIWSFVRALVSNAPRSPATPVSQQGSHSMRQQHPQRQQQHYKLHQQQQQHQHNYGNGHHQHAIAPMQHHSYPHTASPATSTYQRVVTYLTEVADRQDLDEKTATTQLHSGLPDLLEYLQSVFIESHSELLQEAHQRLQMCLEILATEAR